MMWWDHGHWGAGQWFAMGLMMVIFWGAVVVGVWVLRGTRQARQGETDASRAAHGADEVLAQRFVRGEIDEHEFATRRDALRRTAIVPSPPGRR